MCVCVCVCVKERERERERGGRRVSKDSYKTELNKYSLYSTAPI